jgi:hypothetical protein
MENHFSRLVRLVRKEEPALRLWLLLTTLPGLRRLLLIRKLYAVEQWWR